MSENETSLAPLFYENSHWITIPILREHRIVKRLLDLIGDQGVIAGSFASYIACRTDREFRPRDIDIFCTHDTGYNNVIDAFGAAGLSNFGLTTTLALFRMVDCAYPIQLINADERWQDFRWELMNSFDFTVSRAVVFDGDRIVADEDFDNEWCKVLRIHDPMRTLKRAVKYMQRGIQFPDHELYKILTAWHQMNPERKERFLDAALSEYLALGVFKQAEPEPDYSFFDDDDFIGD